MAIAPKALVPGVARTPLPYGVFSVLAFRPEGDGRWQNGVTWEVGTCAPVDGIGDPSCIPDTPTTGLPKNLDGNEPGDGEATPFTLYGHYQCSPIANFDRAQDKATDHLLGREEQGVEHALWTGDLGSVPSLAGSASTITGPAMSIIDAIAALEGALATQYGGLGVIHMTRRAAMHAIDKDAVEVRNGRLTTALGTPVVAGSGYTGVGPTGSAAPGDDESWIYITPPLFAYRGEVFTSSNRPGDLLDRAENNMLAVAERTYVVGFDPCGVTAVLASVGSGGSDNAEVLAAITASQTSLAGDIEASRVSIEANDDANTTTITDAVSAGTSQVIANNDAQTTTILDAIAGGGA